jgi:hypothetical protein
VNRVLFWHGDLLSKDAFVLSRYIERSTNFNQVAFASTFDPFACTFSGQAGFVLLCQDSVALMFCLVASARISRSIVLGDGFVIPKNFVRAELLLVTDGRGAIKKN